MRIFYYYKAHFFNFSLSLILSVHLHKRCLLQLSFNKSLENRHKIISFAELRVTAELTNSKMQEFAVLEIQNLHHSLYFLFKPMDSVKGFRL